MDASKPILTVNNASGEENSAISLDISAALTDTDGSESLSVTISGVPAGASMSAGTENPDGSWILTRNQLSDLSITPPKDSDNDFQLTVIVTATETAGGAIATVTGTIDVVIDAEEGTAREANDVNYELDDPSLGDVYYAASDEDSPDDYVEPFSDAELESLDTSEVNVEI